MLLEIAAANAVFATLSTALGNGKSLYDLGESLAEYFDLTHKINTEAADKNSSGSPLQAFQAQEDLKRQREQLRYHLGKSRLCAWSDFIKFESNWHKERKERELELRRKKHQRHKAIQENISIGLRACGIIAVIMAALFGVALYLR